MDCFTNLLCAEDYRLIGVDDDEEVQSGPQRKLQQLFLDDSCADYALVPKLLEKEREMMPREDYLARLQSGGLDVSARNDSVDWIYKVYRHYSFEPLTACLAVNYLDRFLSEYELPRGSSYWNNTEPWKYQLLSVSCLSVAAKMEETSVPMSVDLQVIEGNLIFEPKTIQRMELLLLSVLKWRTNAVTPLAFMDYFLQRFTNPESPDPKSVVSRSVDQLILTAAKGVEFLEFRPSEIALAVAISLVGETQIIDLNNAFDFCSSSDYLEKERVLKCYELVQEVMNSRTSSPPLSPAGVLDAATLLSYDSSNNNGTTGGGFPSSGSTFMHAGESVNGSAPKRRRLNLLMAEV